METNKMIFRAACIASAVLMLAATLLVIHFAPRLGEGALLTLGKYFIKILFSAGIALWAILSKRNKFVVGPKREDGKLRWGSTPSAPDPTGMRYLEAAAGVAGFVLLFLLEAVDHLFTGFIGGKMLIALMILIGVAMCAVVCAIEIRLSHAAKKS